jgi:hypothetical protein
MTQGSRVRLAAAALAASLMLGTVMATAAAAPDSHVSGITVSGTQAVGTFNGVPYAAPAPPPRSNIPGCHGPA